MGKILPEFLEEGNFEGKDSAVRIKLLDTEKGQLLKIRFHTISKYGANEKYKWINHIFLVKNEKVLDYSFLQEVEFESNQINIFREPVFPPSLTKKIIDNENYSCFIENEEIKDWVQSNDPNYIFERVTNSERNLPIVLMSKTWEDKRAFEYPGSIAKRLLGLLKLF